MPHIYLRKLCQTVVRLIAELFAGYIFGFDCTCLHIASQKCRTPKQNKSHIANY